MIPKPYQHQLDHAPRAWRSEILHALSETVQMFRTDPCCIRWSWPHNLYHPPLDEQRVPPKTSFLTNRLWLQRLVKRSQGDGFPMVGTRAPWWGERLSIAWFFSDFNHQILFGILLPGLLQWIADTRKTVRRSEVPPGRLPADSPTVQLEYVDDFLLFHIMAHYIMHWQCSNHSLTISSS